MQELLPNGRPAPWMKQKEGGWWFCELCTQWCDQHHVPGKRHQNNLSWIDQNDRQRERQQQLQMGQVPPAPGLPPAGPNFPPPEELTTAGSELADVSMAGSSLLGSMGGSNLQMVVEPLAGLERTFT